MKSFAVALLAVAVAAQDLGDCTQRCINDMIVKANTEFGCDNGDTACYCEKSDFANGLRDCTMEACGEGAVQNVVQYGLEFCAGSTDAPEGAASRVSTALEGAESTMTSMASEVASATSSVLSDARSVASELDDVISSAESDVESMTSEAASGFESATSAAGDEVASATDEAGNEVASATDEAGNEITEEDNENEEGAAALHTAAPLAAGLGIAAMLFI